MTEIKRQRIWEQKYTFGDAERDGAVGKIAQELGTSPLFAVLLYNRGHITPESAGGFLRFEETDFHDPYLMTDMDKAVDRILSAVENKEKICIYGDYDVDGVTSVSMLYLYLTRLGAEVGIKIPKRDGEGYGVSSDAVATIAADGTKLIITVDTGITANKEVEYAATLGVDFVITDHHECHGDLPRACAVVNPHRPDCSYPFSELAGVGVVFKTICACEIQRARVAGEPEINGVRRVCAEYADLVAVGTIADVMPLVDENRLIVSLGLSRLERGEGRPGLLSLLDASSKKQDNSAGRKVTSGMIGFGIAPRINAAGRISDAIIAVKLLLVESKAEADKYTELLCQINDERRREENSIAAAAYEMIEQKADLENDRVIILDCDDWQQGIIGIVSSRITEKYGLPSILISFCGSVGDERSDDDDGKGSGRSIKGLNLVEALGACEELLVKYGGHELAAGLTVKRGNIELFRQKMNEYARQHITDDMLNISMEADCELCASDINMSFADEILRLEPFGIGNPAPAFIMRGVQVKRVISIGGGKHTKLLLSKDDVTLTAMCFGTEEGALVCSEGDLADIMFTIDINDYRGVRSVQLVIKDMVPSESVCAEREQSKRRYDEICAGGRYRSDEGILPDRADFARVYTVLRREFRMGAVQMTVKNMLKLVNDTESVIGYVKLKYILRILNELKICTLEEISSDTYRMDISFTANKTSIEKSSILKKLRGQCIKT